MSCRRSVIAAVLPLLLGACAGGTIEDPSGDWGELGGAAPGTPGSAADGGKVPGPLSTPGAPGATSDPGNSGALGNGPNSGGCSGASCGSERAVASSAFSRLSHRQWAATVRDLLALASAPDVSGFSTDPPSSTEFDNNGGRLVIGPDLVADYDSAVEKLAADLVADAARLAKIAPAGWPSDADGQARSFVATFGERAFRRPLTAAELDSYSALFKRGPELFPGADVKLSGVQLTVQALLSSPSFQYRVELGKGASADGALDLTDYEIASRLSYMLWDSLPDQALFDAAQAGALHDPNRLAEQARRMLADPRAAEKIAEFHRQLLELRRYDTMHPAGLPDTIGAAMRAETERFVKDVLVDKSGGFAQLLSSSYSFVNKDLAALYGVSGNFGSDLARVELDPAQRSGLLTQAGFLSYRAGDTAPILRGVFVNEKFLCADLPPPPAFTPPKLVGDTRRERVESVTGKGTCGEGCHATLINPAGFPLEAFDDAGRWRAQDNGHPIDASATYPFRSGPKSYAGPIAWSQLVRESPEAHECYVKHWLEFGFGRPDGEGDAPLIARVAAASRSDGLSVKELLVQLVQSPNFRTRLTEQP